jgi:hypothetical protein
MMALLNHPSVVQQVQFLQPDQLIPWLLLLMVATKVGRTTQKYPYFVCADCY